MLLFATLGKLDFIAVLILMGAAIMPSKFLLAAGIYLVLKGAVFGILMNDFASKIDLISGIYLYILSLGVTIPVVHTLILIWLIQKTALTFLVVIIQIMLFYDRYGQDLPFLSR